ncbi:MAG: hypothetical protein MZV49_04890 [Rhodopseudomonas palustris]|nr:hypothetical protein [Rhodopseudomonas palustris]
MGDLSIYLLQARRPARSCASRSRTSYRHADERITWDEQVYLHWDASSPVVLTQ